MKNKKTFVFILILFLLLVMLGFFVWKFVFSTRVSTKQNNSSAVTLTLPADNYIYCRVDGSEVLYDKVVEANEKISSSVLVISSGDGKGAGIYLTLPKSRTGILQNTAVGQLDDSFQPKIHLSTITGSLSQSFENNYTEDAADYATVTIDEYGTKIRGTFAGSLTEIRSDGWVRGSRRSLTDCRFSVSTIVR